MAKPKVGTRVEIFGKPLQQAEREGSAVIAAILSSQHRLVRDCEGNLGHLHKCRVYFGNEPQPYERYVFTPEHA